MPEAVQAERRVAILGNGYTAAVAASLIETHPAFELATVTSRSDEGRRFDEVCSEWGTPLIAPAVRLEHPSNVFEDPEARDLDATLVTYSGAESVEAVADLGAAGVRVVHLGGDLRLRDPALRREWYGNEADKEADALFAGGSVAYGLTELYREEIREAEIVANPGCYPEASVLGLAPLAREGLVTRAEINGYSGTSGGGLAKAEAYRSATQRVIRYGEDGHRHQPEIEQELRTLGSDCTVAFRPRVICDEFQGMVVKCRVTPACKIDLAELRELYEDAYRNEPFVDVVDGTSIDEVQATNLCRIVVGLDEAGRVLVDVYIDNLWKGASGQAIQNLNAMFGIPEEAGLAMTVSGQAA